MLTQDLRPYNLDNLASDFNYRLSKSPTLSKPSQRSYRSDILHFINWLKANKKMAISSSSLVDYLSLLTTGNIPTKSINRKLSALRLFFDYCFNEGIIEENYAKTISNIKTNSNFTDGLFDDCPLDKTEKEDVKEFFLIINR